jgi:hypothetical protein
MAGAPTTHKVQAVLEDGKAIIEGFGSPLDIVPKGTPVSQGQELRGWLNEQGKYGPYLKVAEDRPQSASNGPSPTLRDDATGRSIERQVAAYCTTALIGHEGFAAIPDDQFPKLFRQTLEAVHAAIRGDESLPF